MTNDKPVTCKHCGWIIPDDMEPLENSAGDKFCSEECAEADFRGENYYNRMDYEYDLWRDK